MDELLQELINFVKTASPALWEIAVKQVGVLIWQNLIWAGIFLVSGTILIKHTLPWCHQRYDESDDEIWQIALGSSWIVAIFCFLIAICNVITVIGYIINPDFRAIQLLLNLVKK